MGTEFAGVQKRLQRGTRCRDFVSLLFPPDQTANISVIGSFVFTLAFVGLRRVGVSPPRQAVREPRNQGGSGANPVQGPRTSIEDWTALVSRSRLVDVLLIVRYFLNTGGFVVLDVGVDLAHDLVLDPSGEVKYPHPPTGIFYGYPRSIPLIGIPYRKRYRALEFTLKCVERKLDCVFRR